MARYPRQQEREALPRDSARGDDRRGPEAEAGAPRHGGQGTRQGRLRIPAVRCGVPIACLAQEGERAPPEAERRDASVPVPRRGTGIAWLTAARPRGRVQPLGLLRLSHRRRSPAGAGWGSARLLFLFCWIVL